MPSVQHWYNFVLARAGERRVAHTRHPAGGEMISVFVIIASEQNVCAPSPLCLCFPCLIF